MMQESEGERTHLLHLGAAVGVDLLVGTLAELLVLGIDVERDLEELLVEEGHSSLETPGHGRLVGSEAVGRVEVLGSLDEFLVERLGVRGGVEVEVSCGMQQRRQRVSLLRRKKAGQGGTHHRRSHPNPHH